MRRRDSIVAHDRGRTDGIRLRRRDNHSLALRYCNIEDIEPNQEEVYLQLLQVSDYDRLEVIQCKVEIDRTVYYCGIHSHISIVSRQQKKYVH